MITKDGKVEPIVFDNDKKLITKEMQLGNKAYTIEMSEDKKTVTFTEKIEKPVEVEKTPSIEDIINKQVTVPDGYSLKYNNDVNQVQLMKGENLKSYFTVGNPENADKKDASSIQKWVEKHTTPKVKGEASVKIEKSVEKVSMTNQELTDAVLKIEFKAGDK